MADEPVTCLSCGVFRMELRELIRRGELHCRTMILDSMLHMTPALLEKRMEAAMAARPGEKTVILYGDCHPGMQTMQSRGGCAKVAGLNCCEIILGHDLYKKLQTDKTFIFLPEWTVRWREIFCRELGLDNREVARSFMKEYCGRFVYVDTGVAPVQAERIREIEEFFQIPVEIISVSLDPLRTTLAEAITGLSKGK